MNLGRVDNFNDSNYVIAFAPESKTTQEIMEKVASAPFMKGMFSSSSWRFPDLQNIRIYFGILYYPHYHPYQNEAVWYYSNVC